MAKRFSRKEINNNLNKQISKNKALLMFGAGIGLTAKCAELGGADLIGVYTTAIYRMRGLPSLLAWMPYGNVNEDLLIMADEILPIVKETPLIAGIGAHDPSLDIGEFLDQLTDMGFSGVTNEPFSGIYGEFFKEQLKRSGIGFEKEVELIEKAANKDIFTVAWCMSKEEGRLMAEAGADVIGAIVGGVTAGGTTVEDEGSKDIDMDQSIASLNDIIEGAMKVNPDIKVLTHGGPINDVESAKHSIINTKAHGYAAGSSGERIPTEEAVIGITKEYKNININ